MKLKNKTALITGATSGIGKAIAELFIREGASVAVNYRSDDEKRDNTERELTQLLESLDRPTTELLMVQADIADEKAVQAMFEKVCEKFGTLDILVNNAGVDSECPSHELEWDSVTKELDINLRGPTLCSILALRHFLKKQRPGCILNNTSVHEVIPKPGFLPYSIAKGGMRMLTQTLALEYARSGIRVNAVGPGVVDTKMNAALKDDQVRERIIGHVPQRSVIAPEEVAKAFAYLASDDAKSITGQTLFIDGGLTLYPDFETNWSSP